MTSHQFLKFQRETCSFIDAWPYISYQITSTKISNNTWHSAHLHPLDLAALSFSGQSHWFWENHQNASLKSTPWQSPSCATNTKHTCQSDAQQCWAAHGAGLDRMRQKTSLDNMPSHKKASAWFCGNITRLRKCQKSPLIALATQIFVQPARPPCLLAASPHVGSQPNKTCKSQSKDTKEGKSSSFRRKKKSR